MSSGKAEISHLEGVSVYVTHKTKDRAVEARSQIEAEVREIIRRSDLRLYNGSSNDPTPSKATLNIEIQTTLSRDNELGIYVGTLSTRLDITQRATLSSGQVVRADTYYIVPPVPPLIAHGRNVASKISGTGLSESALVLPGGPRKTLEVARRYVRTMVQKFVEDWSQRASN
jgi:hypothetical protein